MARILLTPCTMGVRLAVLVAVLCVPTRVLAREERAPADLAENGAGLREIGITLTLVGSGLALIGDLMVLADEPREVCEPAFALTVPGPGSVTVDACRTEHGAAFYAGLSMLLLGAGALAVGIPLWAVGASRIGLAERRGFRPGPVQPFIRPIFEGAVAGFRVSWV